MTPFALNHYHLIPQIEKSLQDHEIDQLVFGLGPTAHLLPYLDQSYVRSTSGFTAHDGVGIYPAETLILLDPPEGALKPGGARFAAIYAARPFRILVLAERFHVWKSLLHPAVHRIMEATTMKVLSPTPSHPGETPLLGPEFITAATFPLEAEYPHTALISPVAGVTLAWSNAHRTGSQRIGVIGVDMIQGQHHTGHPFYVQMVDKIMCVLAEQAEAAGGCIVNLSPITSLRNFAARTPLQ